MEANMTARMGFVLTPEMKRKARQKALDSETTLGAVIRRLLTGWLDEQVGTLVDSGVTYQVPDGTA